MDYNMEYIRKYYKVPARKGGKIKYKGKIGKIIGAHNSYLKIKLDGEKRPGFFHPTYEIEYLED